MAFSSHVQTPSVAAFQADPILAALARHREAWADLVNAPPEDRGNAFKAQVMALAVVIATPCTTQAGAESLLRHLRVCLASNGVTLPLPPHAVDVIAARIADLVPLIEAGETYAPITLGAAVAAVVRSLGWLGEVAAALVLVVGGAGAIGLASLL